MYKELTGDAGFQRMKAMAKHRTDSIEFKRQVAQEFLAGKSLHGLSRRHDVSRNLIRIWVAKLKPTYDEDAKYADLLLSQGENRCPRAPGRPAGAGDRV